MIRKTVFAVACLCAVLALHTEQVQASDDLSQIERLKLRLGASLLTNDRPTGLYARRPRQPYLRTSQERSFLVLPSRLQTPKRDAYADTKQIIIDLTNAQRVKEGLPPVHYSAVLERSAQRHADDMEKNGYFSHYSLAGSTPQERMQKEGYGKISGETCNCRAYRIAFGENLARAYGDPEKIIAGWMRSKRHREAILSPHFREIGIGIQGNYWTQNFGGVTIIPWEESPPD